MIAPIHGTPSGQEPDPGKPKPQTTCQTIAFQQWEDMGEGREELLREMQANHFYTRRSMLPGGQKTGCENMLTSCVFALEAIAAPIKY